jgi:ParB family chromosome partitioning protein
MGDAALRDQEEGSVLLPISQVETGLNQPRKYFDEAALEELAASVRQHGILQPLTVRRLASGYYQIIAGERRWRAAKMAGLAKVPAIVVEADDRKSMELALIENLQREVLIPVEEARGYQVLLEEYGLKQEEVSERVGKSRPAVANALRLLQLPAEVLDMVQNGSLSGGHARALLALKDKAKLTEAARHVVKEGMSVRQAELLVKRLCQEQADAQPVKANENVNYLAEVEKGLSARLGRKVRIVSGKKKGRFEIEYYNEKDFDRLLTALEALNLKGGKT